MGLLAVGSHDISVDLVLSIFAAEEFLGDRVGAAPGGWLVLVYPGPNLLAERRPHHQRLHRRTDKGRRYANNAVQSIGRPRLAHLRRRTKLDPAAVCDAVPMGRAARYFARPVLAPAGPIEVTFHIQLLLVRKPEGPFAENSARRRNSRLSLAAL